MAEVLTCSSRTAAQCEESAQPRRSPCSGRHGSDGSTQSLWTPRSGWCSCLPCWDVSQIHYFTDQDKWYVDMLLSVPSTSPHQLGCLFGDLLGEEATFCPWLVLTQQTRWSSASACASWCPESQPVAMWRGSYCWRGEEPPPAAGFIKTRFLHLNKHFIFCFNRRGMA